MDPGAARFPFWRRNLVSLDIRVSCAKLQTEVFTLQMRTVLVVATSPIDLLTCLRAIDDGVTPRTFSQSSSRTDAEEGALDGTRITADVEEGKVKGTITQDSRTRFRISWVCLPPVHFRSFHWHSRAGKTPPSSTDRPGDHRDTYPTLHCGADHRR